MATALAPPDVGASYDQASQDILQEAPSVTSGYQSPFTTNETTGALEGAPTVKPSENYITPETTVQGQLESILKSDSPLLKLAETKTKEQASALGMSSSSMAIGAAQKALYETALPIAEIDAKTSAAFKQQQQALEYEQTKIETEAQVAGQLNLQKAQLQEQQSKIQASWETTLKGLDAETNAVMSGYQAELNKNIKEMEMNLQSQLNKQQYDAQIQGQLMTQSQDMLNNYQITIQQLLGNQAFLESMPDKTAMRGLFNEMFATVSSSIAYSAKAAGVYTPTMQSAINELVAANVW